MKRLALKQYVVNTFTDSVFKGNIAAICFLDDWLPEKLLQKIAQENNLPETAFIVKRDERYTLRWFTPGKEMDLCGHATLGAAYVLMQTIEPHAESLGFYTKSGLLTVVRNGDYYAIDLPSYPLRQISINDVMETAIGVRPVEAWIGRDLVCVLPEVEAVLTAEPKEEWVKMLDGLMLHLTASGKEYDCVTRSFGPKIKVYEAPVCASGHCHVIPLWAEKLEKTVLTALQASERSGILHCQLEGNRVVLGGGVCLFSQGEIYVPTAEFAQPI